jgi:NCAIR mutase (PurE)-related protein
VAGVHRLLAYQSMIEAADVVIVAAGMEGALASVVASLTATAASRRRPGVRASRR